MRLRLIHPGRAAAAIVALLCLFAATAYTQSNTDLTASIEPLKVSLDLIEGAVNDARSDQALAELANRVGAFRDDLGQKIATLESRLARTEARLKELGA